MFYAHGPRPYTITAARYRPPCCRAHAAGAHVVHIYADMLMHNHKQRLTCLRMPTCVSAHMHARMHAHDRAHARSIWTAQAGLTIKGCARGFHVHKCLYTCLFACMHVYTHGRVDDRGARSGSYALTGQPSPPRYSLRYSLAG